jgi:deoxyribose-phosphate aldolase
MRRKKIATKLVLSAGADFVKTSTGFGTAGATLEDVELLKSVTQNKIQIKASGGIRDYETATKIYRGRRYKNRHQQWNTNSYRTKRFSTNLLNYRK